MTSSIIVKKKFKYLNIELRIVDRHEEYLNSGQNVTVRRILAPNNKSVPISINHKETLKSIIQRTIVLLDSFKSRGANITKELTEN